MLKLPWLLLKYLVIYPVVLIVLYFGLMQPISKRLSLLELSKTAVDGFASFSAFGDFTAKHIGIYRGYYNAWLPEENAIQAQKDSL